MALEDYARALFRAEGAQALPDTEGTGRIAGVRLHAPALEPAPETVADLRDFARQLAEGGPRGGLGWS